jgi:hypothetical protein
LWKEHIVVKSILRAAVAAVAVGVPVGFAQTVQIAGTRTQYQVHEPIELSILDAQGDAAVQLQHEDGSIITLTVPASAEGNVRLVTIDGGTLRPGKYTAKIGESTVELGVAPDEHANAFWTAQWVHQGATPENIAARGGWMYFTGDYVSLHPRTPKPGDLAEAYVAASMKPYALMVCGGGHQLDLDLPNDWGDPWVQRAVAWRSQLAALSNRIYPIAGNHIFDEPGLTWWPVKDEEGKTLYTSPFAIPHQLEEFTKLTGKQIPTGDAAEALPKLKPIMEDWLAFFDLRMKYLGQAWYASVWGTQSVHPQFQTVNQVSSSYAPHAATDGVDSRQNKPYTIVSGHGQYSDLPYGKFQPLRGAESMQGFSWDKPHIYLPMWYTHNWQSIRIEVWASFASKIEGQLYTPEQDFSMSGTKNGMWGTLTTFEIAELNRRLARIGGVMNTLPKRLAPVAVIQSHTQAGWDIANENHPQVNEDNPWYASRHRDAVNQTFFRILETGMIPNCIDEAEIVEKGADFLQQWKVLYVPGLQYAKPEFKAALEAYVKAGGTLVQNKGDGLIIDGATVLEHQFPSSSTYYREKIAGLLKDNKEEAALNSTDLAWRQWTAAGAPNFAKELADLIGEQPFESSNKEVLLGVHNQGDTFYVFLANNAQNKENPRGVKNEQMPAETNLRVPAGVLYDALNGGEIPITDGQAQIKLAAGDGAVLVHLPSAPPPISVEASVAEGNRLNVAVTWGPMLPFRVRIFDPSGKEIGDYYRGTNNPENATRFETSYVLGINAAPGEYTVRVDEWLTGKSAEAKVSVAVVQNPSFASADADRISIYFDDAQKIANLVAGKMQQPDYSQLNWDAPRVMGLDPKKFAIFAPEADLESANKVAEALRGKGMTVEVNPEYAIVPFKREPNRGGAGPRFREQNFENIYANTIVLGDHPLLKASTDRGHINRPPKPGFPGDGRAYVQWGAGCYQAGWENVFIVGNVAAGTEWLLATINGNPPQGAEAAVSASVQPAEEAQAAPPALNVASEVKLYDTPVGVGVSADGSTTFVALHDGSVSAYDKDGKPLWNTPALMLAMDMKVSPRGDRLAIAGYPGVVVIDTATGQVLDGYRAAPKVTGSQTHHANQIISVAWNDAGTLVAAGWSNNPTKPDLGDPQKPVILSADGKVLRHIEDIPGSVMGVAFVPGTDTLLIGADQLTAINAADGSKLWTNDLNGAFSFAFSADGQTAAAGTFIDRRAATFSLASVVGSVAFLPDGSLAAAVWGGTKPLYVLKGEKPEPLFQSKYAFQSVMWNGESNQLIACEQGGNIWLLDASGAVQAKLDDEAGTTVWRAVPTADGLLVGRMNRVVQHITR